MKKRYFIILSILLITVLSCASKKNMYKTKPAALLDKNINVVLYSFLFPKNMTNASDKIKYLNTEIYADYVLNSFISNMNKESEMLNIKTLRDVIGQKDFDALNYQTILSSSSVSGNGTLATNYISDSFYESMKDKVDAIMTVESSMSFWSQTVRINFTLRDLNKKIIWQDSVDGVSRYIVSDITPTRRAFYQTIITEASNAQRRHQTELYTVIDDAVNSSVNNLKTKSPYMFSTNYILFTQKTFSLTNENYAKKAGL